MKKGSVYRARRKMKWAGLILFVFPMITDIILKHEGIVGEGYWSKFILFGLIWTIIFYTYVVGKIWKDIKKRYINIIVHKITNYHFICIRAMIDSDWDKIRIVLDKSLIKYDPSSPITYFIKGAYSVGTNDIKSLGVLADEIETIKNESISGL